MKCEKCNSKKINKMYIKEINATKCKCSECGFEWNLNEDISENNDNRQLLNG